METLYVVIRSLLIAYVVIVILALLFADRVLFQPHPSSYRDDGDIIKLTTRDGARISAVYLPNPKADFTILYSHGNGEDLGDIVPLLREFQRRGFALLAYDYRGYGTSEGSPSEARAYRDIEAAYDYLTGTLAVRPERIILHGYSVGSGPTMELATRRAVGGVVIESGFTAAFRTVTRVPLIPFDRFRNIDRVGRLSVPLLVIHGTEDRVIPFSHGRKLFAAAHAEKRSLWVAGAGHWDLREMAGERYWKALGEFAALLQDRRGAGH